MRAGVAIGMVVCGLLGLGTGPRARGESLDAQALSVFPKDVREIGYVDLKAARQLSWFKAFEQQTLPGAYVDFEEFLGALGINPETQISQLAWALGASVEMGEKGLPSSGDMIGVLVGNFDAQAVESFYTAHHLRMQSVAGHTIFACGNETTCRDVSFLFLDSGTVAFGSLRALRLVISTYEGETQNLLANEAMRGLVQKVNGDGAIFWGVLGAAGARQAVPQVVPGSAQFPQAEEMFRHMNSLVVSVEGSSEVQAKFELVADTAQTAGTLLQLLQAGILLQQYRVGQSDAELAKLIGNVQLAQKGNALDVTLAASHDEIAEMVRREMFLM